MGVRVPLINATIHVLFASLVAEANESVVEVNDNNLLFTYIAVSSSLLGSLLSESCCWHNWEAGVDDDTPPAFVAKGTGATIVGSVG